MFVLQCHQNEVPLIFGGVVTQSQSTNPKLPAVGIFRAMNRSSDPFSPHPFIACSARA